MVKPDIIIPEWTLLVDTREQAPFRFNNLKADSRDGHKPLVVRVSHKALQAGDYSIEGFEDQVAVERKSREDAFATWISDREHRGIPQLEKLATLPMAFIVLECTLGQIAQGPLRPGIDPDLRKRQGKSLYRSILAWMCRYPSVHWVPCDGRGFAELTTYRLLSRWVEDRREKE